jgi:DNA-binding NarL/FixJ family response regulator
VYAWQCVAAHVSSAFRVRRQFSAASRATPEGAQPAPDAVLRPDGRLEHAVGAARSGDAREALRRAVLSIDRSRGALRRRDPERAVAIWQALVAGQWSLVDHFDSDGRRFVVAHRNDARVPDARGLTLRERQVIAYAALGHSNKVIAYELGLAASTVASHLAHARAKLRLPSFAALGYAAACETRSGD